MLVSPDLAKTVKVRSNHFEKLTHVFINLFVDNNFHYCLKDLHQNDLFKKSAMLDSWGIFFTVLELLLTLCR